MWPKKKEVIRRRLRYLNSLYHTRWVNAITTSEGFFGIFLSTKPSPYDLKSIIRLSVDQSTNQNGTNYFFRNL